MAQNHRVTSFWHRGDVVRLRRAASPGLLLRYASAARRRLPDYIVVGAQKAGTTSLHNYLTQHPDVAAPIVKEINFFDRNYHRGPRWYRMHFPLDESRRGAAGHKLTGEASPGYTFDGHAPERIASVLPEVKLILLLRNPVDRAYSQYQHRLRRRRETGPFEDAVAREIERLAAPARDDTPPRCPAERRTYLARGLYFEQLVRWQRNVSPSRLLILESGHFFTHTAEVFEQVCDFLGLRRWQPPAFGNRYPGRYDDRMHATTRRKLVDYFAPHNARLYDLLGTRFDWDH